jgi:hypothetical protein
MPELVEFPLESGGSIVVEVEPAAQRDGVVRRGFDPARAAAPVVRATESLEAAFDRVGPAAAALIERLRRGLDAPAEIELEFGIQLSAEIGVIIASSSGHANVRVRATWKRAAAEGVQ